MCRPLPEWGRARRRRDDAAIELVEAVGLWPLTRWGEYLALFATGVFPLEIHGLTQRVTPLTKRLFGLRGGRTAYEAGRRSESLVEIEHAAMAGRDPSL
ncbi:DUF2127 domain-containing protein [Streptosporangium saharense]|uniref:DUF2127 domain-containing protein n=1 Tax=Streptosporangium saharense TaxID=1706840 RepID=UPI00331FDA96